MKKFLLSLLLVFPLCGFAQKGMQGFGGGFIMSFGFHKLGFFVFAVIGLALVGFGGQAKLLGNGRNIQAYFVQQNIPVAKEGIEKISPSMGKAAEQVAKGIKKGLSDDNTIYCKYCGAEIDVDSSFCKKCGKEL